MKKISKPATKPESRELDPRFASVVAAFKHRRVTRGGKGFGSSGLKVNGKLFAFMSSKGKFVAKLPKTRVDELVRARQGQPFDPGHGRVMKQWIALDAGTRDWVALAGEAYRFVKGASA